MREAQTDTVRDAALEQVINTDDLKSRPARAPDHAAENRAFVRLAKVMAHSPHQILQTLTDEALELCRADTAGISIIEDDNGETVFRWHALSGALAAHLRGTTPRHFSPCGTVVDRNSVLLMSHLERHFRYFADVRPEIVEALLIPFTINGQTIGTLWVVMHDEHRKFDREDERLLQDLAEFTAAAYTLRLALDASKEIDKRKDELLAMVAHELRNPLSAVRNAFQYVQARLQALHEPQLQAMNEVGHRQLNSMTRMIDDLLDITRIRLNKVELRKERVSVGSIVQQAVDSCLALFEASRHQLTISLPEHPLWVEGDTLRLAQVVNNLLNNAAKYTPEGGKIEVSVERAGDGAVIRIRDNGIGISASIRPRVFDLFAQGDSARERTRGGLGIGLTLVRRFVELHGGGVVVRSDGVGKGSEFVVTLPLADGGAVTSFPAEDNGVGSAAGHVLRILVVDDHRDSADSLAILLSAQGHDVRTAYDGGSALETARSFRPEVTLQDIGMPDMDGYEVARKLRELPQTQHAALIAMTGFTREEDAREARAAGFDHHLGKPVDFDALDRVLRSL
jgi:signal transduction histidine kinase/CheY-like chemotaxis protein